MKLINKTPHAIHIADMDGRIVRTIEPTLPAARVSVTSEEHLPLDGVPFRETIFREMENLPPEDEGANEEEMIFYIVSSFVISARPERRDLVRPDTGPTCVRDGDGKIIAVRALTR